MAINSDGSNIIVYNGASFKIYSTGVSAGAPYIITESSGYTQL